MSELDWGTTRYEGNRLLQHESFRALPLRDKLVVIEQLGDVASVLLERWRIRSGRPLRERAGAPTAPNPDGSR